jgi:hypothetical protein
MIKHTITRFLTFSIASAIISLSGNAFAQERWVAHKNENQLYEVRVPAEYESKTSEILIGNHTMAFGDMITATVPSDEADSLDKIYTVKFIQTLGAGLTKEEIDATLEALVVQYLNKHVKYGGLLVERRTYSDSTGLRVGDLYITYNDPERGPSHARTRIYLSSVSKAQQTVTGSESAMFSYRSKDFFDSMSVYDGYAHNKDSIETAWKPYTSPFNVFTAYLPDEDGLYVTQKPVIHKGKRSEVIGFKFYDPFLEKTLSYNVYSHKFNVPLHEGYVTQALQKFHLQKNRIIFRNSSFVKRADGVIEALFPVQPTEKNNYATFGKLVAEYEGKNLLVHEIYGTETLVISNFIGNVMDSVEFHPKRATEETAE